MFVSLVLFTFILDIVYTLIFKSDFCLQKKLDKENKLVLFLTKIRYIGESFRIIHEFRILRLTLHRKSASKC